MGLILLVLSLVLLTVRAFGVNTGRVDLGWLGLAVLVLSMLLAGPGLDL